MPISSARPDETRMKDLLGCERYQLGLQLLAGVYCENASQGMGWFTNSQ